MCVWTGVSFRSSKSAAFRRASRVHWQQGPVDQSMYVHVTMMYQYVPVCRFDTVLKQSYTTIYLYVLVCTCFNHFIPSYTVINGHIPWYTVISVIPVHTSMYQYVIFENFHTSTYFFILFHTIHRNFILVCTFINSSMVRNGMKRYEMVHTSTY